VQVNVGERHARAQGIADACRFYRRSYDVALDPDYDAIVAIESLIHAPDLRRTIANLAGGLRPGGVLLVLDDMATGDLDAARPADAAVVRANWGCPGRFPSDADFRAAIEGAGLRVVAEEDFSPLMRVRAERLLARQERILARLKRAVPLAPVRTIASAFLGGVALERLRGSGDVGYRLIVARRPGAVA
jgi:SAM-dependent methyltransferase